MDLKNKSEGENKYSRGEGWVGGGGGTQGAEWEMEVRW